MLFVSFQTYFYCVVVRLSVCRIVSDALALLCYNIFLPGNWSFWRVSRERMYPFPLSLERVFLLLSYLFWVRVRCLVFLKRTSLAILKVFFAIVNASEFHLFGLVSMRPFGPKRVHQRILIFETSSRAHRQHFETTTLLVRVHRVRRYRIRWTRSTSCALHFRRTPFYWIQKQIRAGILLSSSFCHC